MSEGQAETGDFKKPAEPSIEKQQEQLLRSKYSKMPPKGGAFLQQRLARQKKFFDSGDYNMAKAKVGNKKMPAEVEPKEVTGDHMPTPAELPMRKPCQSKLAMH